MKKLMAIILALVMVASVSAVAFAGNLDTGGTLSGKHYNLNIIGVPNQKNLNFDGGEGARIFVLRDKPTSFFVGNGTSYEVLDHNGTDGKVGTSVTDPGIRFPYENDTWQVEIYVRLVGPKTSDLNWTTYWDWDGSQWLQYATFHLDKSSKFTLKTGDLLKDGYENILWVLDPQTKFRNLQMRIYLVPEE